MPIDARARWLEFRRRQPPRPPLERLTVRVRGLDFAVWRTPAPEAPSGPPLCCVNGGLLFGHRLLWPALAPLAQRRQLVLYDQRGRGESAAPPGVRASRIEFDGDDLVALRSAMGLEQWDLLGHSWGGGIAMLAAAADPAAVARLVLVNAVGVTGAWLPALHDAALARLTGDARDRLAALSVAPLETPDLPAHAEYAQAFFPAWFADAAFAAQVAPPRGDSLTGAVVAARLRREGYDWSARLRDLPVPALVVHGVADVLPLAVAEQTAAVLGRARLAPLADAGHNPFWEAPDAFFTAVDAFLLEGRGAP